VIPPVRSCSSRTHEHVLGELPRLLDVPNMTVAVERSRPRGGLDDSPPRRAPAGLFRRDALAHPRQHLGGRSRRRGRAPRRVARAKTARGGWPEMSNIVRDLHRAVGVKKNAAEDDGDIGQKAQARGVGASSPVRMDARTDASSSRRTRPLVAACCTEGPVRRVVGIPGRGACPAPRKPQKREPTVQTLRCDVCG